MDANRQLDQAFRDKIEVEMQRAKRYRIFLSMVVFDLSSLDQVITMKTLLERVQAKIRAVDDAAMLGVRKLGILLPETTRQGAEMAAKRLSQVVKESFDKQADQMSSDLIPVEMASYPDAAGARTIPEFLHELDTRSD